MSNLIYQKKVNVFFASISLAVISGLLALTVEAMEVVKKEDGFYTAASDTSPGLYFALERVPAELSIPWLDYSAKQMDVANEFPPPIDEDGDEPEYLDYEPSPEVAEVVSKIYAQSEEAEKDLTALHYLLEPISKFAKAMRTADRADVWIAYATHSEPLHRYQGDVQNIEMAVAVVTKQGSPIVVHIGIHRGAYFYSTPKPLTKGLSASLHAFAAQAILEVDSSKVFMVTTPLSLMKKILVRALPQESYWTTSDANVGEVLSWTHNSGVGYKETLKFFVPKTSTPLIEINSSEENSNWFFENTYVENKFPYFIVLLKALSKI